MTTSSDNRDPCVGQTTKLPVGEHWFELTAALPPEPTAALGRWLEQDLLALEHELDRFVTPRSFQKSLRR